MGKMRLKTDHKFQQTAIKKLNKEFNVDMYSTNLRGGKAFAAELKIRELINCSWDVNVFRKSFSKWIELIRNELIKKTTFNLNNTRSAKYGFSPEKIEEKSLEPERWQQFKETHDFSRLWRVKEVQGRSERYAKNLDARKKRKLSDPLDIGKKVLVLTERLKKKKMLQVDHIKTQQKKDLTLTEI